MKVKFNKQVTVDFESRSSEITDKTFYRNEVVECDRAEETARSFLDLHFANGDVAIGVPRQSLTVL